MNKACVITGAAGGIGHALLRAYKDAGYKTLAIDHVSHPKDLDCDIYIQIDLERFATDEAYSAQMLSEIKKHLPEEGLAVLVNNAAVQLLAASEDVSREAWARTIDINLSAPFFLVQGLVDEIEAFQGCVINIGSIHADLTKKKFVAYATSKAGLVGLTKALAIDLGHRIRVNLIQPAAIETEMLKEGFLGKEELYKSLIEYHPTGRIGSPEEVANLALLISDRNLCFLNGACIKLDGGIGARLHDPD